MIKKHNVILIAISCMHILMFAQSGKERFDDFNKFMAEKSKNAAIKRRALDNDLKKNEYYRSIPKTCGQLFSFAKKTYDPELAAAYEKTQSIFARIVISFQKQSAGMIITDKIVIKDPVVSRVINAEHCKQVVAENGLTYLAVPKKMICPSKKYGLAIVAEKINANDLRPISSDEKMQIFKFAEKTTFRDWGQSNLLRSSCDNKIYFIDTEPRSFDTREITKSDVVSSLNDSFLYRVEPPPLESKKYPDPKEKIVPIYKKLDVDGLNAQAIRDQFKKSLTEKGKQLRDSRINLAYQIVGSIYNDYDFKYL